MSQDPLDRFMDWFLKSPPIGFVPLLGAVSKIEEVTSVLWFRRKPFQVQLFVVPPNYVIPEHKHPNVDSYEVYLGGQIKFSHSGRWVVMDEEIATPADKGLAPLRGKLIRVRPQDLHGGIFGKEGGVFMSVQHWLNGVEPHCVAADYDGVVMGPNHLARVVNGRAVLKERLKPVDAASAETDDALPEVQPRRANPQPARSLPRTDAKPRFKLDRPKLRMNALGLAVNHLMAKPAFMTSGFSEMTQTLAGLINRDHYVFVHDEAGQVQGFAGWGLTSRSLAEHWLGHGKPLKSADCRAGACIVMMVWSANSKAIHQFMFGEFRRSMGDKEALFYWRHYQDGRKRPVRLINPDLGKCGHTGNFAGAFQI